MSQLRQPAGSPAGGQFAATTGDESASGLVSGAAGAPAIESVDSQADAYLAESPWPADADEDVLRDWISDFVNGHAAFGPETYTPQYRQWAVDARGWVDDRDLADVDDGEFDAVVDLRIESAYLEARLMAAVARGGHPSTARYTTQA